MLSPMRGKVTCKLCQVKMNPKDTMERGLLIKRIKTLDMSVFFGPEVIGLGIYGKNQPGLQSKTRHNALTVALVPKTKS